MKRQLPAALLTGALALLVLVARPVSAHENGRDHWDGNVYHDYRYGGHVDRYFSPYGDEYDRVYRRPENPYRYGNDYYGYGRDDRYRDDDCDDDRFQGSFGAFRGRPSSSYFYNGYQRPYGYRSYDRGWWGW